MFMTIVGTVQWSIFGIPQGTARKIRIVAINGGDKVALVAHRWAAPWRRLFERLNAHAIGGWCARNPPPGLVRSAGIGPALGPASLQLRRGARSAIVGRHVEPPGPYL